MTTGKLKIHSENILPIIKRWLYSDKDIFIRELVSNACDAIHKIKILRDRGEYDCVDDEFRIDLKIDKEAKTLTFVDTGIGMTKEEVENYIAQVAFSGAEEFLEKYKGEEEKDHMIGHFGLGFYSAYMVAKTVDINTLSYQEGVESVLWASDGSTEYTIDKGLRKDRGTEIVLHVNEESEDFLEAVKVREILERYCAYLPYPVFLNDSQINKQEPLWLKPASECTEQEYLDFYKHLYPFEPEPLFWIHLNVDYPFHLQGILYFPKLKKDFDFNKSNIKLFCNRVFVTDNCKDVIPEYLTMLRGCIDSPDIPLNVSRSTLQVDKTVRQLSSHISKKVSDRLNGLHKNDKDRYIKCWEDIEVIIKLGVLQDQKFYDRIKDSLIWKNFDNEWTTIEEYVERNKEKNKDKIFYTTGSEKGSQLIRMYHDKGIEILHANNSIDTHMMSFLEGKLGSMTFQRIDGGINEAIIDTENENTLLDADGKTQSGRLSDLIRTLLKRENIEVEAKSLASKEIPAFIVVDESMRRMRDYMRMSNMAMDTGFDGNKQKLIINTNSALIHHIEELNAVNPSLASEVLCHVYDVARLAQKELDTTELDDFTIRSNQILEKLAHQVIAK